MSTTISLAHQQERTNQHDTGHQLRIALTIGPGGAESRPVRCPRALVGALLVCKADRCAHQALWYTIRGSRSGYTRSINSVARVIARTVMNTTP